MQVVLYDKEHETYYPGKNLIPGYIITNIPDDLVEIINETLQEGTSFQSLFKDLPIKKTKEMVEVIKNRINIYDYKPEKEKKYSSLELRKKLFPYLDTIEKAEITSEHLVPRYVWAVGNEV